MDVAQIAVQGFFHDPPLGKLKMFIFFHMGISLMCSMFEPDVSAVSVTASSHSFPCPALRSLKTRSRPDAIFATPQFIAVLGYIAVLNNQIEPLNLYLVLQPVSVVVDIIRMSIYSGKFSKSTGGFLVFLVIMKIVGKLLGIWFGYQLSKEWESAPDNYQDFGGNQPVSAESGQAYHVENQGMGGGPKMVHPSAEPESATIPAYQQGYPAQQGYQGGLN